MPHIALLGDSVLDNHAYTHGEPDVAGHLRNALGDAWKVTLLAVDGTTTTTIGRQLDRIKTNVTHLVLSVGGNDALSNANLLDTPVRSTADALVLFGACLDELETSYSNVLAALRVFNCKLTVCTIYNGNLAAAEASRVRIALMLFNDVIVRSALAFGADVIELRAVCTAPSDFVSGIEPSSSGGGKIAKAIARAIASSDSAAPRLYGAAE